MARHDLQTTQLRCPDQTCGGAMVRDECGVFCEVCGFEAVTWADPVDADVPMNVIVRRERTKRCVLASAIAALLVAMVSAGGWLLWSSSDATSAAESSEATAVADALRSPSTISYEEMRTAFAAGRFPEALALPSFYSDPDLFLLPRSRTAQSELVLFWQQRTVEEKRELLEFIKQSESVLLLPFLAEIAFYTTSIEMDPGIGRSMLDALYLSSRQYLDLVDFLMRHVASTSPHAEVRADATEFVADLADRRRIIGR